MRARVFVDANLWYPPSCRALLLGVALAGIYEIVTSEGVLDELYRHLKVTEQTNLSAAQALQRVDELRAQLVGLTTDAVVEVDASSDFVPVGLPDVDDEHVLAGALAADADLLITANLADFPADLLAPRGLDVLTADALLTDDLRSMHRDWQRAVGFALRFPPKDVRTPADLGYALHGAGLPVSAGALTSASWQVPVWNSAG